MTPRLVKGCQTKQIIAVYFLTGESHWQSGDRLSWGCFVLRNIGFRSRHFFQRPNRLARVTVKGEQPPHFGLQHCNLTRFTILLNSDQQRMADQIIVKQIMANGLKMPGNAACIGLNRNQGCGIRNGKATTAAIIISRWTGGWQEDQISFLITAHGRPHIGCARLITIGLWNGIKLPLQLAGAHIPATHKPIIGVLHAIVRGRCANNGIANHGTGRWHADEPFTVHFIIRVADTPHIAGIFTKIPAGFASIRINGPKITSAISFEDTFLTGIALFRFRCSPIGNAATGA